MCNCEECRALQRHMNNLPEQERTEDELDLWSSYRGPRIVMLTRTRFSTIDQMLSYFWIAARMGAMEAI